MIALKNPFQITLLQAAALALPVAVALSQSDGAIRTLVAALIVTLLWDMVFAMVRREAAVWHGLTTALIVTVMAPPDLPLWQLVLALSFGTVIGEQVFGGRGYGFLNAGAVSLAFLVFSFPGTALGGDSMATGYASLPGLVLLIVAGVLFWPVIAALVAGLIAGHLTIASGLSMPEILLPAVFAGAFLVADPVAAASTNLGRWLHGALAGLLTVLFAGMGAATALVFAALLASLAAPLIDRLVIIALSRRRLPHV